MPNEELAEASGYSVTSSSYTNARGALKSLGAVSYTPEGVLLADWVAMELA